MNGSESAAASRHLTAHNIVVVPCFNEESRLPRQAFVNFVKKHHDIAFLFVDDGSRDGTRSLLYSLQAAAPSSFAVLSLPRNSGKGEAVRLGLLDALSAEPQFVGYWDADLATPLEELPQFIALGTAHSEVFLIMGARIRRLGSQIDRSISRHYIGRVFATLASLVLGVSVYDTQCGAKLMAAHATLRTALLSPFRGRWSFDVELIQRLINERRRASGVDIRSITRNGIIEVPLARWRDVTGSKVRLRDGLWAFGQLVSLWIKSRYGSDKATSLPINAALRSEPSDLLC
jgi:dolichyl-phosphate beta-glucosyltransferase